MEGPNIDLILYCIIHSFCHRGVLMTSIVEGLFASRNTNTSIKRISERLNATLSGAININAYNLLIKKAPSVERKIWTTAISFQFEIEPKIIFPEK